jgi:hypothetical protein
LANGIEGKLLGGPALVNLFKDALGILDCVSDGTPAPGMA